MITTSTFLPIFFSGQDNLTISTLRQCRQKGSDSHLKRQIDTLNGYLARTEEQLHSAGVETSVFDGIAPNPTVDNAVAGADAARKSGADFIVALGGGSVMDCAKAIALLATNPGGVVGLCSYWFGQRKSNQQQAAADCGNHYNRRNRLGNDPCGVITKRGYNEKAFIMHPALFPVLAVVDPELMLTVPRCLLHFRASTRCSTA